MTKLIPLALFVAMSTTYAAAADIALLARIDAKYVQVADSIEDAPEVTAAELLAGLPAKRIFIDARTAAERAVSQIAGSISPAEFEEKLKSAPAAKAADVVVYCTIGYRSGLLVSALTARGIRARNLRGGVLAWIAQGGPVFDAAGKPSQRVHVYAKPWALVPAGFEAVY
jgi:rhodanese-related sulfurtransferase